MSSLWDDALPRPHPDNYTNIHPEQHGEIGQPAAEINETADNNYDPIVSEAMTNTLPRVVDAHQKSELTETSDDGSQNEQSCRLDADNPRVSITELQNDNKFLRGELLVVREQNQRKTAEALHTKQEHATAMEEKRREIEELSRKLETEMDEHHRTKERLTGTIVSINQKEMEYDTLLRDHNACLEALTKAKTESEVRARDRDKHYKEARFYEAEGKRLTEDVHRLQQRNDDLNKSITMLNSQSKAEIQRLESEYETLASKMAIMEELLEKARTGQDTGSLRSLVPAPSLDLSSILSLTDSDQDRDSFDEPRLATVRSHDEPSDSIGYKRFKVTPSLAPHCRNCGMVFSGARSHLQKCGFHAAPSQPYQVWKNQLDLPKEELERMHPDNKYWPCCGKISRREPPGCKVLPRHDLVNPSDPED